MQRNLKLLFSLGLSIIIASTTISSALLAAVSISLTGSSEKTTNALEKTRSNQVSTNVSMGLGDHILLGLTHRRSFDNRVGLKKASTDVANVFAYIPYKDNGESVTNSLDLTIVPYNGLISPFIFGGVARRDFHNQLTFLDKSIQNSQSLFPVPNYGFGTAIQLGVGFQLKITQTYTPGIETILTEDGQEATKIVKDSYIQVWIGYKL